MYPNSLTFATGRRYIPEAEAAPVPLWMHLEDTQVDEWDYQVRDTAPAPAVFLVGDVGQIKLNRQWQYYLIAINWGMELRRIAGILNWQLAFANGTGFGHTDPREPRRANYILNEDTDSDILPALNGTWTTSKSVMTGRMESGWFYPDVLDGRQNPPLKPGKSYPMSVDAIRRDDYLYLPETHPQYFLVAKNVRTDGRLFQWDGGLLYPDGIVRTYLYHVGCGTPFRYAANRYRRVDSVPYPYT